nr:MAG TPA_asm: hypothetical protein [Caudoviricetes sp.]
MLLSPPRLAWVIHAVPAKLKRKPTSSAPNITQRQRSQ